MNAAPLQGLLVAVSPSLGIAPGGQQAASGKNLENTLISSDNSIINIDFQSLLHGQNLLLQGASQAGLPESANTLNKAQVAVPGAALQALEQALVALRDALESLQGSDLLPVEKPVAGNSLPAGGNSLPASETALDPAGLPKDLLENLQHALDDAIASVSAASASDTAAPEVPAASPGAVVAGAESLQVAIANAVGLPADSLPVLQPLVALQAGLNGVSREDAATGLNGLVTQLAAFIQRVEVTANAQATTVSDTLQPANSPLPAAIHSLATEIRRFLSSQSVLNPPTAEAVPNAANAGEVLLAGSTKPAASGPLSLAENLAVSNAVQSSPQGQPVVQQPLPLAESLLSRLAATEHVQPGAELQAERAIAPLQQFGQRAFNQAGFAQPAEASIFRSQLELPLQSQQWPAQFAQRVGWLVGQGMMAAEIQLNPAELGPLQVRIEQSEQTARVAFAVQHSATRDVLEAQLPRLRELFSEQGLDLVDVESHDLPEQDASDGHENTGEQSAGFADAATAAEGLLSSDAGIGVEPGSGGHLIVAHFHHVDTFA